MQEMGPFRIRDILRLTEWPEGGEEARTSEETALKTWV